MKDVDSVKKELRKKTPKGEETIPEKDMLSSGSTLLNLATTGRIYCCFAKGKYSFLVGDSKSGKTFLSLTCFAEAMNNKNFEEYRIIHDNVEDGALMDLRKFFGSKVQKRIESPARTLKGRPKFSDTIEDFYFNLDNAVEDGRPFIYVLDSMDSLTSEAEDAKFEEDKAKYKAGKKAKGSYGDGKAKINSARIRKCLRGLRRTKSILIVINQTRDNIGAMPFQPKKTRSGGHSLRFYATTEIWSSISGSIKKKVGDKEVKVGSRIKLTIQKNRFTGRERSVEIPILYESGIDDIGSCVDYLLENKHWKKKKGSGISATELGYTGTREQIIRQIENNDDEGELRLIVSKVWHDIEQKSILPRKKRYA